jgi:hypothetical protein
MPGLTPGGGAGRRGSFVPIVSAQGLRQSTIPS